RHHRSHRALPSKDGAEEEPSGVFESIQGGAEENIQAGRHPAGGRQPRQDARHPRSRGSLHDQSEDDRASPRNRRRPRARALDGAAQGGLVRRAVRPAVALRSRPAVRSDEPEGARQRGRPGGAPGARAQAGPRPASIEEPDLTMLSPAEVDWDLALYGQEWLEERFRLTLKLVSDV